MLLKVQFQIIFISKSTISRQILAYELFIISNLNDIELSPRKVVKQIFVEKSKSENDESNIIISIMIVNDY
jgi:hypothetical protein